MNELKAMPILLLALVGALAPAPSGFAQSGGDGSDHGWKAMAPAPLARFEAAAVVYQEKLYTFGGFGPGVGATTRTDVFDPATNAWSPLADMPQALTHLNAVLVGDTVWFAGGTVGNHPGPVVSNVWRYDLKTDKFSAGPPLPKPRGGGGLAHLEGKLHFFTGFKPDRDTDMSDHWTLDLASGKNWEPAPPFPTPSNQFGVATVGGKIYVIGGQFNHDKRLSDPLDQVFVHVYDPRKKQWSRAADLPMTRSHIEPSTFVHGGKIYIAGGRGASGLMADLWSFDPGENSWSKVTPIPQGLLAPVAAVVGDRIILATGAAEQLQPQASVWAMDLAKIGL